MEEEPALAGVRTFSPPPDSIGFSRWSFNFPKHYYWHRGFDGLYGTVQRWVQKFMEWNPSLSEEDGFLLMKSLFGIDLPGVE